MSNGKPPPFPSSSKSILTKDLRESLQIQETPTKVSFSGDIENQTQTPSPTKNHPTLSDSASQQMFPSSSKRFEENDMVRQLTSSASTRFATSNMKSLKSPSQVLFESDSEEDVDENRFLLNEYLIFMGSKENATPAVREAEEEDVIEQLKNYESEDAAERKIGHEGVDKHSDAFVRLFRRFDCGLWSYWLKVLLVLIIGLPLCAIPFVYQYFGQQTSSIKRFLISLSILLLVMLLSLLISYSFIRFLKLSLRAKGGSTGPRQRWVEYLERLHSPLTLSGWATATMIYWNVSYEHFCFSGDCPAFMTYISNAWVCLFVSSWGFVLEKYIIQLVSINYHTLAYASRIAENRMACYVINQLKHIPQKRKSDLYEKKHLLMASSSHSQSGSETSFQERRNAFLSGERINSVLNPSSNNSGVTNATFVAPQPNNSESKFYSVNTFSTYLKSGLKKKKKNSSHSSVIHRTKRAARIIFDKLSTPGKRHLVIEDFYPYFKTQKFARQAFSIFDNEGIGKVSRKRIQRSILYTYLERDRLTKSLLDSDDVLIVLDRIFIILLLIFLVLICMAIFNLPVNTILSFTLSVIAGLVFIIGDMSKNAFASIMLVFVLHPFDVGDKITIDGACYIVQRMHLLSTELSTLGGERICYPNYLLAQKYISNSRRSENQFDGLELLIDFSTPPEKVVELKARFDQFIAEHQHDYGPDTCFWAVGLALSNHIRYGMYYQHRSNFQNSGLYRRRNAQFFEFLAATLRELEIKYMPGSEVRGIEHIDAETAKAAIPISIASSWFQSK